MSSVDKQKAIGKFIQECGGEPDVKVPVCALTSLFSARVFGYVETESGDKPVEPPGSGGQDGKPDESKDRGNDLCCMGIVEDWDDEDDEGPGYQTVYVGGLGKKDMQILFTLMCLMPKNPEAELDWVKSAHGVGVVIPKTETNQVYMSAKTCADVARFLYGRGARESTDLFIRDLRKMSRTEFSMFIPDSRWHSTEYNTIPLSVMITNNVCFDGVHEKRTLIGITITLSDIFFYRSHSRYGVFNVEAMFNGMKGKNGDLFARMVSYASRFLPTVIMQRKKGKGYKTSFPIEKVCPGYNTSAKQNKLRTRKDLLRVGAGASPLLLSVSITVVDGKIKLCWVYEKTQQNDGCEPLKT